MSYYNQLYRDIGIRRLNQLSSPQHGSLAEWALPYGSVYHFICYDDTAPGPNIEDPHIKDYEGRILIEHIDELSSDPAGSPMPNRGTRSENIVRDYHKRYRKIRQIRNFASSAEDDRSLIIINYALLNHIYRYRSSRYGQLEKWLNIFDAVFETIKSRIGQTNRQHFVELALPQYLGSPRYLSNASTHYQEIPGNLVDYFSEPYREMLRELWCYLNNQSANYSVLQRFTPTELDYINIIFTESGQGSILNLGTFLNFFDDETRAESSSGYTKMQKAFLRYLLSLGELRSQAGEEDESNQTRTAELGEDDEDDSDRVTSDQKPSTGDDPIDEEELTEQIQRLEENEDVETGDPDGIDPSEYDFTNPEDMLEYRIHRLGARGVISVRQQERLLRLLEQSQELDNPFGEGTLDEFRQISSEQLQITNEESRLPDKEGVLDKSLKQSTLQVFDRKYINEVLDKDIANVIKDIQGAGVIVTDFDVEEKEDAANEYRELKLRLQPVDGRQSTVKIQLPKIRENGTFYTNGVQWRMRKQRIDKPIRKVAPHQVIINSYYGRVNVLRSQKKVVDYEGWLTRTIAEKGLNREDSTISDVKHISVFDNTLEMPRIHSALAKKIRSFDVQPDYHFNLDYPNRYENFDQQTVETIESQGLWFIGLRGEAPVGIDSNNQFYVLESNQLQGFGYIEDILGLERAKAPVEVAEFELYGSQIPIAFILGLEYGLVNLIDRLDADVRRVRKGQRMNLQANEYAVRFQDESLIFNREQRQASLILASLRRYHQSIARYPVDAFERRDVYINILEENGFRMGLIREAELAFDVFVDSITREILERIGEPQRFDELLLRACELLLSDDHPSETDMDAMRIRGYERIAGQVYDQLVRAVRSYRARPPGADAKIDIKPDDAWKRIHKDASVVQVEEANPYHELKMQEAVTYQGTGGRSRTSMVKHTRLYHDSDRGVISEASPDSNTIGATIFLSPNPNFENLRGETTPYEEADKSNSSMVSTSALSAPMSDRDD